MMIKKKKLIQKYNEHRLIADNNFLQSNFLQSYFLEGNICLLLLLLPLTEYFIIFLSYVKHAFKISINHIEVSSIILIIFC